MELLRKKYWKMNKPFDFWEDYDRLCKSLIEFDKKVIAEDLKKVKSYVNGLTDGWFDFMVEFENVIKEHYEDLSADEKNIAENLLSELKKSLDNR